MPLLSIALTNAILLSFPFCIPVIASSACGRRRGFVISPKIASEYRDAKLMLQPVEDSNGSIRPGNVRQADKARARLAAKSQCLAGIKAIEAAIAKNPPKPVLDQLKKALDSAQQEEVESDWDECVHAIKKAKLPKK